ncbi:MAG: helix-turn-helix transcriptional regulator [Oscillospiraceae bacterium]|nr:helix-turn-helix transcriptional regulator [Oscillospiraceae bacterium]
MIGERLAEVRKDHNDRQVDLAQKLNVTLYTIRSWEQEKSSPSHEMLVQICRLYHVSADYLLGLSDHDPLFYRSEPLSEANRNLQLVHEFAEFLQQKNNIT